MDKTTKEIKKVLEQGSRLFRGDEAIEYFAQLVVAGLAIIREARGDKFIDDFLLMALEDKSVITYKTETKN